MDRQMNISFLNSYEINIGPPQKEPSPPPPKKSKLKHSFKNYNGHTLKNIYVTNELHNQPPYLEDGLKNQLTGSQQNNQS